MEEMIQSLEIALESSRNPGKAEQMKAYMKDHFIFYGIQSPLRREITSHFWKSYKITDGKTLVAFVTACWEKGEREWQYITLDVMAKCKKYFDEDSIIFVERLITQKSWWDTVDGLASKVVGHVLLKYPDLRDDCIDRWMASGNIWLQRTCLIFQLKYREKADFELMKTLILDLKESREFFIQKGAGWALRQYSKFRPDLVRSFIESNPDLSGLTKREGLKYC
ncbi:MAG: DNA alkylation repair protein [Saprospiraceae bacterium]|nr:DNA alkylation repair protein [Saprospiraceae bacterium]